MSSTEKMTVEQELAAAVAIVRIGLDRIRDAACRTEDVGPHVAALRTLYDAANPEDGVLAAVADVIGTITVSVQEVDHEDNDRVTELLDEVQSYAQDKTGERIDKALGLLSALLLICQNCRATGPDVKQMDDPFTAALFTEWPTHEQVVYCENCATARFEES
ncbi:hypothetical protein [Streptomyces sp. NBC_01506]|uniref:hypothetical protein n=1 Tax=Streptomyces sp. NBC_01506 TaxID=2903887 RepID=UPI002F916FEB